MKEENLLTINRFAFDFHGNGDVIFCKTDYLFEAFKEIEASNRNVVLISGNSDYCVTPEIASKAPANIKFWFCQNATFSHDRVLAIPIGLENHFEGREGHGYVWGHAAEKIKVIQKVDTKVKPSKLLYANFKVETNPKHRTPIKELCQKSEIVTWVEPKLSYEEFVADILDHEAVVCAQGNDSGDNHRIYETLYLNRIPITFNPQQYEVLHHKLPVILCASEADLLDEEVIKEKISIAKKKSREWLDYNRWNKLIYEKLLSLERSASR